jgi:hypothetical protein
LDVAKRFNPPNLGATIIQRALRRLWDQVATGLSDFGPLLGAGARVARVHVSLRIARRWDHRDGVAEGGADHNHKKIKMIYRETNRDGLI